LPQGPEQQQLTKEVSKLRRQPTRVRASERAKKAANSGAINAYHRHNSAKLPESLLNQEARDTWAKDATGHFCNIYSDDSDERRAWILESYRAPHRARTPTTSASTSIGSGWANGVVSQRVGFGTLAMSM
jgi:hypothetical protein